jgi:hypothetical protein
MLSQLLQQEKEISDKMNFHAEWLVKNYNNPERHKIIQDKNALSVKLSTIRYKIKNIKAGEPMLGYGVIDQYTVDLTKNSHTPKLNN